MGRLPTVWGDRPILDRFPYAMSGQQIITSGMSTTQYPEATFQNGTDKVFEVHRMIPYAVALSAGGVPVDPQPDQGLLLAIILMSFLDVGLDTKATKVPTAIRSLLKGSSELTWEFADPTYFTRSNGYQVSVQSGTFPAAWAALNVPITQIQLNMTFEGFMCVVAAPTNNR